MRSQAWLPRAVLAAWITMALQVASTSSVFAECTSFDRWPSFRSLAPVAETVLVGEVVEGLDFTGGGAIRFVLRVDDVLRGEAGDAITFDHPIQSGLPLECRDSILTVPVGSVIALALDAPSEEDGDLLTTAAFMDREPDPFLLPGIETITREQLRRLMDLPDTDILHQRDGVDLVTGPLVGGTLGLSALAGLAAATRLRRRHPRLL